MSVMVLGTPTALREKFAIKSAGDAQVQALY